MCLALSSPSRTAVSTITAPSTCKASRARHLSDLAHGRVVQGGSTLTQQVAKTLFLTDERSLRRKIQEAILSLWLARHYTKQEILGIYLNRVYLGEGAYGVDAAARLYFGVPATELTLAQAAILAGLPQAPSSLNPLADPRAAADRAREVLNAMVATQRISLAEENSAEQQLDQAAVPRLRGLLVRPLGHAAGWRRHS